MTELYLKTTVDVDEETSNVVNKKETMRMFTWECGWDGISHEEDEDHDVDHLVSEPPFVTSP